MGTLDDGRARGSKVKKGSVRGERRERLRMAEVKAAAQSRRHTHLPARFLAFGLKIRTGSTSEHIPTSLGGTVGDS